MRTKTALLAIALATTGGLTLATVARTPAAFAADTASAKAKPKAKVGRIVRVARGGTMRSHEPLFCSMNGGGDRGQCYVRSPKVGDEGYMVERYGGGVTGKVRVTSVEPQQDCGSGPQQHFFEYDVVEGNYDGESDWVVFDTGIDPDKGKSADGDTPLPDGSGGQNVWLALDRDGDGGADMLTSVYSCDGPSQPTPRYSSLYCFEYWEAGAGRPWTMIRQDLYQPC